MAKKIALVVVWFGEMPSYFNFWQKTCSYNKDVDFYVFTDQPLEQEYDNVRIKQISLNHFRRIASDALGFPARIDNGYKLCDYKVAYGDIFKEYLKRYDYWGYCDIDLAFGNIRYFIEPLIDSGADKINQMGHFCLYKNNARMRTLYKAEGAKWSYKTVYSDTDHYAFDEYSGMCLIVLKNGINERTISEFIDFDRRQRRIVGRNTKNYNNQAFVWRKGRSYQIHIDRMHPERIIEDEKMYIHFQGRKPYFNNASCASMFQIKNEGIEPKKNMAAIDYERGGIIKGGFEIMGYYSKKIKAFLMCDKSDRVKWLKRKVAEIWER